MTVFRFSTGTHICTSIVIVFIFFQNQWWLRLPLPPQLKSVAWISCKTPGKSVIHLLRNLVNHTYHYHCFISITIIVITGLPRAWGHRLRKDNFRESMAFYLQGFISMPSSDHHHHITFKGSMTCDFDQYSTAIYYHMIFLVPTYHHLFFLSSVKTQTEQAELCLRQVLSIPEPLDRHPNSV